MKNWADCPIFTREDGSYVVTMNGMPYHVPNNEEFSAFHKQITDYRRDHPEQFSPEVVYTPSEEELLAQAKQRKTTEIQNEIMKNKLDLVEPLADMVLLSGGAMPVSLLNDSDAEDAQRDVVTSANEAYQKLKRNKACLSMVQSATNIDEVNVITVAK